MPGKDSRYTLVAVCITSFLTPFSGSAMNIAIPAIGKDLAADVVLLTWMTIGFLLTSAAVLLPVGRLADLRGRKPVFLIGLLVFGLSNFLAGLSISSHMLLAMRIVQGFGGAFIFATGMAMLTAAYPPHMRGRVLGINAAVVYIGLSLGPVLGGFITHNLGWRYVFFLPALLTVIAFLAAMKINQDIEPDPEQEFDIEGTLLYALGLVAFMYGMSSAGSVVWGKWLMVAGVLLLGGFVYHEVHAVSPLLELRLLSHNRAFAFSNLAALINYMGTSGVGFLLSIYLQVVKGFDAQISGFILLSQPVIMAVVSPLAGRLSDEYEPRLIATTGMTITTAGLVMMHFFGFQTSLLYIVFTLLFTGLGFGIFSSPNNNAIMGAVAPHQYGVASAILSTMRLVGQTLSMAIVAWIVGMIMGQVQVTVQEAEPFLQSMKVCLTIFAILCTGGIFASLVRGSVHHVEGGTR